MKNAIIVLYFRVGVDVLGFPVICKHIVHRFENVYTKDKKVQTIQEMI